MLLLGVSPEIFKLALGLGCEFTTNPMALISSIMRQRVAKPFMWRLVPKFPISAFYQEQPRIFGPTDELDRYGHQHRLFASGTLRLR